MFRRRGGMRRLRRAALSGSQNALRDAQRSYEAGHYAEAASAFETLAHAAAGPATPRSGLLLLRAGEARVLAGENEAGVELMLSGLAALASTSHWLRLMRAGERSAAFLRVHGLQAGARQVESLLEARGPVNRVTEVERGGGARRMLPTHCPQCGAALRAEEVEWIDSATAECSYCGSPIRSSG